MPRDWVWEKNMGSCRSWSTGAPYEQEAPTMWQHKQSISHIAVWDVLQMMMGGFLAGAFQRPKQRDARKSVIMARWLSNITYCGSAKKLLYHPFFPDHFALCHGILLYLDKLQSLLAKRTTTTTEWRNVPIAIEAKLMIFDNIWIRFSIIALHRLALQAMHHDVFLAFSLEWWMIN